MSGSLSTSRCGLWIRMGRYWGQMCIVSLLKVKEIKGIFPSVQLQFRQFFSFCLFMIFLFILCHCEEDVFPNEAIST